MEDVKKEMTTMREALKGKASAIIDKLIQRTYHPFTSEVMTRHLPNKFKLLQTKMFNSSKDPLDHLEAYKTHMNL